MKVLIGFVIILSSSIVHAEERMINLKHTFSRDNCQLSTFFNDPLKINYTDNRLLQRNGKNGCETHVKYSEFLKDIKFCSVAKVSGSTSDCMVSIEGFDDTKTIKFTNYVQGSFNECLYSCLTAK